MQASIKDLLRYRKIKAVTMLAMINRLLEWFKSLFWKEEMELTLVGLQVINLDIGAGVPAGFLKWGVLYKGSLFSL